MAVAEAGGGGRKMWSKVVRAQRMELLQGGGGHVPTRQVATV